MFTESAECFPRDNSIHRRRFGHSVCERGIALFVERNKGSSNRIVMIVDVDGRTETENIVLVWGKVSEEQQ